MSSPEEEVHDRSEVGEKEDESNTISTLEQFYAHRRRVAVLCVLGYGSFPS